MGEKTSPVRAVDLPSGSIVADDLKATVFYASSEPGEEDRWEVGGDGCRTADSVVDYALRHGAEVVRRGDAPAARESLARHLQMQSVATWDESLRHADEILAGIAGKES